MCCKNKLMVYKNLVGSKLNIFRYATAHKVEVKPDIPAREPETSIESDRGQKKFTPQLYEQLLRYHPINS
jgi:hypothetical protein